jgi:hypothetical protein
MPRRLRQLLLMGQHLAPAATRIHSRSSMAGT